MIIPFSPPYNDVDIENEVLDSLRSGWITTGPKVKALEDELCKYVGVEASLGVNSATSAMMLVLHWYGIAHGDEVIVPSFTFPSTANAFVLRGARIVFADSGRNYPNIDVEKTFYISGYLSYNYDVAGETSVDVKPTMT